MPEYIFNTTALSNFALVSRLDLLETRYHGLAYITVEVVDELRKGVNAGYTALEPVLQVIKSVNPAGWLHVLVPSSIEDYRLRAEFDHLVDPVETSCLALAVSRG